MHSSLAHIYESKLFSELDDVTFVAIWHRKCVDAVGLFLATAEIYLFLMMLASKKARHNTECFG